MSMNQKTITPLQNGLVSFVSEIGEQLVSAPNEKVYPVALNLVYEYKSIFVLVLWKFLVVHLE
jgi:hypothetical protein